MHRSYPRPAASDGHPDVTPLQESIAGALLSVMVSSFLIAVPLWLELPPSIAFTMLLGLGASLLTWLLRARTPRAWRQRRAVLRLRRPRGGATLALAAVGASVAAAVAFTVAYAHVVHEPSGGAPPWAGYVKRSVAHRMVGALAVVAVAPVIEELAFRGVLLTRLEARMGEVRAVGSAAALFALLHGDLWGMPTRFAIGVLCGALAWSTDSVWTAVLLHAAWNAFAYFDPITRLAPQWAEGPRAAAVAVIVLAGAVAAVSGAVARLGSRSRAARLVEEAADVD